jgi:hypothetical protein
VRWCFSRVACCLARIFGETTIQDELLYHKNMLARERESERKESMERQRTFCVWKMRDRVGECVCVCVYVYIYVCVCSRERESVCAH